jgi:hypothetical protein
MASFAKVEEDRLVERMGDPMIKEEGILKAKLSFPFVISKQCVMITMKFIILSMVFGNGELCQG